MDMAIYSFISASWLCTLGHTNKEVQLVKGRKRIIDYDHSDCMTITQKTRRLYAKERLSSGDEQWTRYTKPKQRNEHH